MEFKLNVQNLYLQWIDLSWEWKSEICVSTTCSKKIGRKNCCMEQNACFHWEQLCWGQSTKAEKQPWKIISAFQGLALPLVNDLQLKENVFFSNLEQLSNIWTCCWSKLIKEFLRFYIMDNLQKNVVVPAYGLLIRVHWSKQDSFCCF